MIVTLCVWCIGHVVGAGDINPAVTMSKFYTGKISFLCLIIFIIAQCVGATVGAAILYGITPANEVGVLGVTNLHSGVTVGQGFGIELIIAFTLVFTVHASCDSNRVTMHLGSVALFIGLAMAVCHMFAVSDSRLLYEYTGRLDFCEIF